MKNISLSAGHYAAKWKTEGVIKPLVEINELARVMPPARIRICCWRSASAFIRT